MMTKKEFFAELDARKPEIEMRIQQVGMIAARKIIIGAVIDAGLPSDEVTEWWDLNFSQRN